MKKLILACALGVSATLAGLSMMGPVSAQPWGGGDFRGLPDGSWRESCRYPQMRGGYLSAECRTSYDRWVQTQINANNCRSGRVGNSDGRLICEDRGGGWYQGGGWNLPGGSWRQTCRYPVMRGSYLSAQCPTMGDRWANATIDVRSCRGRDISNQNGQLYCDGRGGWGGGNGGWNGGGWNGGGWNGGGGRYPGGSWQETCRDGDMRGSTFSAQCRAGDGYWNGSSIDLRNCRSNRLGNNNGRLVCE